MEHEELDSARRGYDEGTAYRGSALMFQRKRPFLLFVFAGELVILQPPLSSPTFSMNEARHVKLMAFILKVVQGVARTSPNGTHFLEVATLLEDEKGIKPHGQLIAMQDIRAARLSLRRLRESQIFLDVPGNPGLDFAGPRSAAVALADLLAETLGDRLSRAPG